MISQSALNAYSAHSLNIQMKTSSGDVITLDFNHEKSLQLAQKQSQNTKQSSMLLSSKEEFSFSIDSNGIDEQDKKEIAAFMELAKPFIDNFLEELQNDNPTSPVTKVAQDINSLLSSFKEKDTNTKNYTKNSLVALFDKSLQETKAQNEAFDKLFEDAQKLLEKTLQLFDTPKQPLYA